MPEHGIRKRKRTKIFISHQKLRYTTPIRYKTTLYTNVQNFGEPLSSVF